MEIAIVGAIVGLAVFFFIRGVYRGFKTEDSDACGCGCSTCPSAATCAQPAESEREP